jgi:peptidoglycan/LPS O-acetylase OafA/YrhL
MPAIDTKEITRSDTAFIRAVAILLIVNSHLDLYYPIPYLGTGGAIGNSLFFVLSSFGLLISEKKKPRQFTEWYTQRIKRIYPTIWVVVIILTLPFKLHTNALSAKDVLTFAGNFFYPSFWFLQALMIFYFIGFFIIKKYNVEKFITFSLLFLHRMYSFTLISLIFRNGELKTILFNIYSIL